MKWAIFGMESVSLVDEAAKVSEAESVGTSSFANFLRPMPAGKRTEISLFQPVEICPRISELSLPHDIQIRFRTHERGQMRAQKVC